MPLVYGQSGGGADGPAGAGPPSCCHPPTGVAGGSRRADRAGGTAWPDPGVLPGVRLITACRTEDVPHGRTG